jgi:hypothetical protein
VARDALGVQVPHPGPSWGVAQRQGSGFIRRIGGGSSPPTPTKETWRNGNALLSGGRVVSSILTVSTIRNAAGAANPVACTHPRVETKIMRSSEDRVPRLTRGEGTTVGMSQPGDGGGFGPATTWFDPTIPSHISQCLTGGIRRHYHSMYCALLHLSYRETSRRV